MEVQKVGGPSIVDRLPSFFFLVIFNVSLIHSFIHSFVYILNVSIEDGMILYLKAGEDGTSVGDCPFGQQIRMVLEEKNIPYQVKPCTQETKPNWLVDYYDGQLPALRHKKECYIESNIIVSYLDYFFPSTKTDTIENKKESKSNLEDAEENALVGFFPSIARYLKDDETNENNDETLEVLKENLDNLENHFKDLCDDNENKWCYLDGSQTKFSNVDCRIIPQLYHLLVASKEFKENGQPNLEEDYPFIYRYLQQSMTRDSFVNTKYAEETIIWGWNNARQQQQQVQQE